MTVLQRGSNIDYQFNNMFQENIILHLPWLYDDEKTKMWETWRRRIEDWLRGEDGGGWAVSVHNEQNNYLLIHMTLLNSMILYHPLPHSFVWTLYFIHLAAHETEIDSH